MASYETGLSSSTLAPVAARPPLVVQVDVPGPATAILRPAGELDMLTAPSLAQHLDVQLRQGRDVILDLTDVRFFGAAAIRVLLDAHREARQLGSTLHVTGAGNRHIARPLRLTGTDEVLTISGRAPDALAAELTGRHRS